MIIFCVFNQVLLKPMFLFYDSHQSANDSFILQGQTGTRNVLFRPVGRSRSKSPYGSLDSERLQLSCPRAFVSPKRREFFHRDFFYFSFQDLTRCYQSDPLPVSCFFPPPKKKEGKKKDKLLFKFDALADFLVF